MENDIIKFIKGEIFGIMVSTNKKLDHYHETVILAYTHNDKFIGRDGEFHQSHGGYKSNIILLPKTDLNFVLKDETVKLFRNVKDYENYLKLKFDNDSKAGCVSENIDEYDPKHMYYRCVNLGTCIRKAQNFNNWEFECNGIKLNGFDIQDPGHLADFGYVVDCEDINNVRDKLISSALNNEVSNNNTINSDELENLKIKNNQIQDELENIKIKNSQKRDKITELLKIINENNHTIKNLNSTIDHLKSDIIVLHDQQQTLRQTSKLELKNTQKNCASKLKRQTQINQQLNNQITELQAQLSEAREAQEQLKQQQKQRQQQQKQQQKDKSDYLNIPLQYNLILTICIIILSIFLNLIFISH